MTAIFKEFPKIPRSASGMVTISEKMDGTNACVIVVDGEVIGCQSRGGLICAAADNFGFADWVESVKLQLPALLGDGYHYGEWVGPGIQKNPHKLDRKYFYLFNTFRHGEIKTDLPIRAVRVLYQGPYDPKVAAAIMEQLSARAKEEGYDPEGVIIYHHSFRSYEKMTFKFPEGKWKAAEEQPVTKS